MIPFKLTAAQKRNITEKINLEKKCPPGSILSDNPIAGKCAVNYSPRYYDEEGMVCCHPEESTALVESLGSDIGGSGSNIGGKPIIISDTLQQVVSEQTRKRRRSRDTGLNDQDVNVNVDADIDDILTLEDRTELLPKRLGSVPQFEKKYAKESFISSQPVTKRRKAYYNPGTLKLLKGLIGEPVDAIARCVYGCLEFRNQTRLEPVQQDQFGNFQPMPWSKPIDNMIGSVLTSVDADDEQGLITLTFTQPTLSSNQDSIKIITQTAPNFRFKSGIALCRQKIKSPLEVKDIQRCDSKSLGPGACLYFKYGDIKLYPVVDRAIVWKTNDAKYNLKELPLNDIITTLQKILIGAELIRAIDDTIEGTVDVTFQLKDGSRLKFTADNFNVAMKGKCDQLTQYLKLNF